MDGPRHRRLNRSGHVRIIAAVVASCRNVQRVPRAPRLPVVVSGVVVAGDSRGRELGFPTANLALEPGSALPDDGIYAGWARRPGGEVHLAAVSIGRRPTYYGDQGSVVVEAYLLDFSGDLYGERLEVGLEAQVRGQARFDSTEALVARMQADVAEVARLMAARR
jgi:FAD synthase